MLVKGNHFCILWCHDIPYLRLLRSCLPWGRIQTACDILKHWNDIVYIYIYIYIIQTYISCFIKKILATFKVEVHHICGITEHIKHGDMQLDQSQVFSTQHMCFNL